MKKVLVILLFVFVRLILVSQNTHVARHSSVDRTGDLVNIGKKYFYLESIRYYCCADSVNLVCCNENGDVLYKYTPSIASWMTSIVNLKIKATPDKCLLFSWGSSTSCDVGGYTNYMSKVDTMGNVIFNQPVLKTRLNIHSIVDFVGLSDSTTIFCTRDSIYKLNKLGLMVSKSAFANKPIYCMENLPNNKIFVSAGSATIYCTELSTSLTTVNQQTCAVPILKLRPMSGNNYVGSAFGALWKFNSNFSQATTNAQLFCTDFCVKGDSIYFVGITAAQSKPYYGILNASLVPVYSNTSSIDSFTPSGIALGNNKVKMLGCGSSATQPIMSFSAFHNLNINGIMQTQTDLALSDATVTAWYKYSGSFSNYIYCDMAVKVKNKGNQNIKSFYLNNYTTMAWCAISFHKAFQMNLVPGDSAIVNTGNILVWHNEFPLTTNGSPITATPCVFSSVPNGQLDADISNDSFCKAFTVGYVGLNETANMNSNLAIFPNPFHDEITITSTELVLHYELMDVYGSLVQEGQSDDKTLHLKTNHLKAGIYFIQVQTKFGLDNKKLVKE